MIKKKNIGILGAPRKVTFSDVKKLRTAKKAQMQKQRLARRKATQELKQRVHTAKTGLDRRQAKTTLKALKVDKKISRANRKGNIGKVKKLTGRLESLAKRNAGLRQKQMARAGVTKAPSRRLIAMQKAEALMRAKRKG